MCVCVCVCRGWWRKGELRRPRRCDTTTTIRGLRSYTPWLRGSKGYFQAQGLAPGGRCEQTGCAPKQPHVILAKADGWEATPSPVSHPTRHPFPSKENQQISERDDLGPPVVPGGQEIGLGSQNLRPRAQVQGGGHVPRGALSLVSGWLGGTG